MTSLVFVGLTGALLYGVPRCTKLMGEGPEEAWDSTGELWSSLCPSLGPDGRLGGSSKVGEVVRTEIPSRGDVGEVGAGAMAMGFFLMDTGETGVDSVPEPEGESSFPEPETGPGYPLHRLWPKSSRRWRVSASWRTKFRWHSGQLYGFILQWVRMCLLQSCSLEKALALHSKAENK